jgi:predicted DsbA family dithiol-disulfide isomerase
VTTHATRPLIESDHANAIRMGIESTPTFVFVNQGGDRQATGIAGAQALARFRQVIDSVLTAGR